MAHFQHSEPTYTARYVNADVHGGNHAPSSDEWWDDDDTLDRQGVDLRRPRGHGICKGIASSWVMAFLNGENAATNPAQYESYFANVLRYQATFTKDYGGHIDGHIEQMKALNLPPNVKVVKQIDLENFTEDVIPNGRWAAYVSVWKHDIAIGGKWGAESTLYINEPNTGLLGYKNKAHFFEDLNRYIAHRRRRRCNVPGGKARFWICQSG